MYDPEWGSVMYPNITDERPGFRLNPLAACLSAALLIGPTAWAGDPVTPPQRPTSVAGPAQPSWLRMRPFWPPPVPSRKAPLSSGNTLPVTSCADDNSPGTLRTVVAAAVSGDVVDLSSLSCSAISLQNGSIPIDVDDITLQGPGAEALVIQGDFYSDRILDHSGAGVLTLTGLTVSRGRVYTYASGAYAEGGCIRSSSDTGVVSLVDSAVSYCTAAIPFGDGSAFSAQGGCISASNVRMLRSTAVSCRAYGFTAVGGAVSAGYLYMNDSRLGQIFLPNTIYPASDGAGGAAAVNTAVIVSSRITRGLTYGIDFPGAGLAAVFGSVTITDSTLDHNYASGVGGAVWVPYTLVENPPGEYPQFTACPGGLTIRNSTISGNSATNGGAIYEACPNMLMSNSTVAFNRATGIPTRGGAVMLWYGRPRFESSIIANNETVGTSGGDLVAIDASIAGSNNLIVRTNIPVPRDTLRANPRLGDLTDNGGPQPTLALLPGSAAIDAGSNPAGLLFDARGEGYPRVVGASADIGAFEVQQPAVDLIFVDAFD